MLTNVHVVKVWMWQLNHREGWVLKNWCFQVMVLEKTLESPLDSKEIKPVSPKGNQLWILTGRTDAESWSSNTLATWCEKLTQWKRPWCWGRLRAGGEGGDTGWNGWMASLIQWTWVWANSGSWRTAKPGVLQSVGSQRVGHDWATEQKQYLHRAETNKKTSRAWKTYGKRLKSLSEPCMSFSSQWSLGPTG